MVGQGLPFGILARKHVAGTVIGQCRRACIRANQAYDIPKAVSFVNCALAARVGDFGHIAIGIIAILRGFACWNIISENICLVF